MRALPPSLGLSESALSAAKTITLNPATFLHEARASLSSSTDPLTRQAGKLKAGGIGRAFPDSG